MPHNYRYDAGNRRGDGQTSRKKIKEKDQRKGRGKGSSKTSSIQDIPSRQGGRTLLRKKASGGGESAEWRRSIKRPILSKGTGDAWKNWCGKGGTDIHYILTQAKLKMNQVEQVEEHWWGTLVEKKLEKGATKLHPNPEEGHFTEGHPQI